jgi:hypothetical protein
MKNRMNYFNTYFLTISKTVGLKAFTDYHGILYEKNVIWDYSTCVYFNINTSVVKIPEKGKHLCGSWVLIRRVVTCAFTVYLPTLPSISGYDVFVGAIFTDNKPEMAQNKMGAAWSEVLLKTAAWRVWLQGQKRQNSGCPVQESNLVHF